MEKCPPSQASFSFALLPVRHVLLHPPQMIVDVIRPRGRRLRPVDAFAQLGLHGGAPGCVVARGRPACYFGSCVSWEKLTQYIIAVKGGGGRGGREDIPRTLDMMAMQGFSTLCLGLCTRRVLSGGSRMGLWVAFMAGRAAARCEGLSPLFAAGVFR